MRARPSSDETRPRRPPGVVALWIGGAALLWALYAAVFVETTGSSPASSALDALANVLPLALLAVAVRSLLLAEVMRRSTPVQALWHAGLAVAFATTWYATILVMLALVQGLRGRGFSIAGFSGPAFTWQVFQGLILYAAIAAVCYALRGGREAAQLVIAPPPPAPSAPPLTRYLIRQGEEMTPVDVADIVSITGAQDYSEVATLAGRHLVRLSLGEFAARLDGDRFVRVHRSTIIQLSQLVRTEPAGGGRLLAHMEDGQAVPVSRAGALALRRFVV